MKTIAFMALFLILLRVVFRFWDKNGEKIKAQYRSEQFSGRGIGWLDDQTYLGAFVVRILVLVIVLLLFFRV